MFSTGIKLKEEGDQFSLKLNPEPIFDKWCQAMNQRKLNVQGPIFTVTHKTKAGGMASFRKLAVNYTLDMITFAKETNNLKWLGYRPHYAFTKKALQVNQNYPHAITLMDTIKSYERACERMQDREEQKIIPSLLASSKLNIQKIIIDGAQIVWDNFRVTSYVETLTEAVSRFQDKVDDIHRWVDETESLLVTLETCGYSEISFRQAIDKLQSLVDELNLMGISNMHDCVSILDKKVEGKLMARAKTAAEGWVVSLLLDKLDEDTLESIQNKDRPDLAAYQLELHITQQVMHCKPPVLSCRAYLMDSFNDWIAIVACLPRLRSSRFEVELGVLRDPSLDLPSAKTYRCIFSELANLSPSPLIAGYAAIDRVSTNVDNYVKEWTQYQSLWDMEFSHIIKHVQEDLALWQQLLGEIKKARGTVDNTSTRKAFGPIVVVYSNVQAKVNSKYEMWHKEIIVRFGRLLNTSMIDFHAKVSRSRGELENHSVEASSTAEAVSFIIFVQNLKRQLNSLDTSIDLYRSGQTVLERQRYQFPSGWLYMEHLEGEWSAFSDILKRKDQAIQTQVATLKQKIIKESVSVEQRGDEVINEWDQSKPVQGTMKPENALTSLSLFESKLTRLKDDRENIIRAIEALEITDQGPSSNIKEQLTVALEELNDLKGVWSELSRLWQSIDELRDQLWASVQPRKVRNGLDNILTNLRNLPARMKQYASWTHVQDVLKTLIQVNVRLVELKSDALKERHWKDLKSKLSLKGSLSELTLGQLWDVDLVKNDSIVRDICLQAQGEMGLEEFLRQVRECWHAYQLDLVTYQNKCQLIRGWDDLFNKCREHLNSLAAMKLSPYFRAFEEEAFAWEDKLNRVQALFDVWIDMQRRWVYLDGIFGGSADIKHLLPIETQRFQTISTEFLTLMRKVAKACQVMEVLNIPQVQKLLERLADLLAKIQKALGEYLERERSSFPRFYFVGDEDLLEIIGNSKNVDKLQKHFKKMFAGISAILLSDDNVQIQGVSSKEGEEVRFATPISLKEHPKINDWLALIEQEMRNNLAQQLTVAVREIKEFDGYEFNPGAYVEWVDLFQAQLIVLASQIFWSERVEEALISMDSQDPTSYQGIDSPIQSVLKSVEYTLTVLADCVLREQPPLRRKKLEHLIIESVHQRDVIRSLIHKNVSQPKDFHWLAHMRFYFDAAQPKVLDKLSVHMAAASFHYGFEYLGVQDRLVQTPLTDRCYLTMTQALQERLGGSPFGPAGTGKTESVKALGHQLGRFVLVFNCDEHFDFQAMGRIFVGLCQVGAWGCFDEFNRLEERILSAVSQQIQTIQEALKEQGSKKTGSLQIELIGKQVRINTSMAIFVTMNPGYAGRSNLPDNLKRLFRSLSMTKPDRQLIAQVMLYSQGFRTGEVLASKIVPFFQLCEEQLSIQSHYDFGLRALKSVLVSSGNIKRDRIARIKEIAERDKEEVSEAAIAEQLPEQEILIQSVVETMVPKLVAEDISLLKSLLSDVFPGVPYTEADMDKLREQIRIVCHKRNLTYGEGPDQSGSAWVQKVLQIFQISQIQHGLMMVGPSGSGKSSAWQVLQEALQRLDGAEGVAHVIDPKGISKEALYGVLDPNTREWTDGLFTHILRKIIDNVRGELSKRQWVVFDGDVDPEWVENLNSVLDDNKMLTLPNGERLSLPPNLLILFEVQDLKYATLATVSRCGMVWFSEEILKTEMVYNHFITCLRNIPLDEVSENFMTQRSKSPIALEEPQELSDTMKVQHMTADALEPHFALDGLVQRCLNYAETMDHIMEFTRLRALNALFSLLRAAIHNILLYNLQHHDFPLAPDQLEQYVLKSLITSIIWSFTGDAKHQFRNQMGEFIRGSSTLNLPSSALPIIDYQVDITGEWSPWVNKVPNIEVETHRVAAPDVVVPTLDTVRHEALLNSWLSTHVPMVLCGPPGSGKTMTLFAALRSLPDFEVVGLNFSSATTPELLLKTFDHYCEFRRTPKGLVMSPMQPGKWLILFCDEINLPDIDTYGTQRVICFLRQLVEHGGFYRPSDQAWVNLERIQFVGACNPPTDPGRKPLSHRFLRHVPVIYVDYPGETSLSQIYGTYNRALLRLVQPLKGFAKPLTDAMVEFYTKSQSRFTQDMQPHYIYSPREMTRWVRGILEYIQPLDGLSLNGLVRIWAHEALRLFRDRLVTEDERKWTDAMLDTVAHNHFPGFDPHEALARPILYSSWQTKDYMPVSQDALRDYVHARLRVFYEEELDVQLVLFDEVLDNVLRIDRVLRQVQGHLLLIGVSGSGKTTLSRFVAWMNGFTLFQVKVHNKYKAADFDEDLRNVLRRSGCRGEKIVFIMDESNVLDTSFLERLNTLLANGEVPGLFEGDEFSALLTQCKDGSHRQGLMLDSQEELYKWFTAEVMKNLHVVFTMNPATDGLKDRAATSPALFNRCVVNWFGDWSTGALYQVGYELTNKIDLENPTYQAPHLIPLVYDNIPQPITHRSAIVNSFVFVHKTLHQANVRLSKRGSCIMTITPRHYLDFLSHFVKLTHEKRAELEEQQLHLNVGLNKIRETVDQVEELQSSLGVKKKELEAKRKAANEKLQQMVRDRQEAETQKSESEILQLELERQTKYIRQKQLEVSTELAEVEPAVKEAQQSVHNIKKSHLHELRSLINPPPAIMLSLEAVCCLLAEPFKEGDWKTVRAVALKEGFIQQVTNFDTRAITQHIRDKLESKYMTNKQFTYEAASRASQACGPLVKWAIAQIRFSVMLHKIEPLENERTALEKESQGLKDRLVFIEEKINDLENRITVYQQEYELLVTEAKTLENELTTVETKVGRSRALLASLTRESGRWKLSSQSFHDQMATLIGDVLLSAAFLAYGGYFDQQFRQTLFHSWANHLSLSELAFREDLARTEYLSTPDERLQWQQSSLPTDDLCTENAIMLKRFNRYPLLIDPSGQATEFILKEFSQRKVTKTSFLDESFRKNLESALRFGNPILVQDAESYDPILNPVLNRELKKTGGRVLVTIGDQDIDLSPAFTMVLSTRDPSVQFSPDICSRVTFVNFTVTRSSLQTQCLNQVLKAERPDVDQKRSDLLKLQGEYRIRLLHLEKSLLSALNEVKGRILDDDTIITHLETLKKEAAEVQLKVDETSKVMSEIEHTSHQYLSLAQACSGIFFLMDTLPQIHFLYQFSLQFFLDIFTQALHVNSNLAGVTDYTARLKLITTYLFELSYTRVGRGMLHADRICYAILLAFIFLKGMPSEPSYTQDYDHLLRGSGSIGQDDVNANIKGLSHQQSSNVHKLRRNTANFSDILLQIESGGFLSWLLSATPELNVPELWTVPPSGISEVGVALNRLLIIQALRPDRILPSASLYTNSVFGESIIQELEREPDLPEIVKSEVKPTTPILFCSMPGFDVSGRVDDLSASQRKPCTSIAMGSAEGFDEADKAIRNATKSGGWVLLKNVHLSPSWLTQLEKKLHTISSPHPNFRLFLTTEINPKIPVNLLRIARKFVFEPPPGIKANLMRTFSTIPVAKMCREPNERARLYFLLAWFHAVVQERLRYSPQGWSKTYEFNESDLRMACDVMDSWIDTVSQGRTNISPDKVPWFALNTLFSQCIYGGKIDNDFDQRLINNFLGRLFVPETFEEGFTLVSNVAGFPDGKIKIPEGIRRDEFITWVTKLPDQQMPSWLGLSDNADEVLLISEGSSMLTKTLRVHALVQQEEELLSGDMNVEPHSEIEDGRPAWMRNLKNTVREWISLLPEVLNTLVRTAENLKDPIFRFFEREVAQGAVLLDRVRTNLNDIVQIVDGKLKMTNLIEALMQDLHKGVVPISWLRYKVPTGLIVLQWIKDFVERINQLQKVSETCGNSGYTALKQLPIWMGGLFAPEAFVTATRQNIAQNNSWSLEELVLEVTISEQSLGSGFVVTDLLLEGGQVVNGKVQISEKIASIIPYTCLSWSRLNPQAEPSNKITIPVYLNHQRLNYLFSFDLSPLTSDVTESVCDERGVCLLISSIGTHRKT